jgi:malonate transporter and related proteins
MLQILSLAVPFFALIALGLAASKLWAGREEEMRWLNIFVLYFALPALIFKIVAATPLDQLSDWRFVLAASAATGVSFFLARWLGHQVFHFDSRSAALFGTATSYGNVGYMGLPLSVAFFGQQAGVPAAIVFCIDCTLLFLLTAATAAERKAGQGMGPLLLRILRDIVTHPFIVASVLGVVASAIGLSLPGAIATVIDMLARAAGPAALFALGLTVGLRPFTGLRSDTITLSLLKLIVQPALMFVLMYFVSGAQSDWLKAAVMMAALPTASNAFILARQHNSYVDGASMAVLVTTVVSAVTVPAIVFLLN